MTDNEGQLPPAYDLSEPPSELPAYTRTVLSRRPASSPDSPRPQNTREFTYRLKNWGKTLATLTLFAPSRFSGETPVFAEGGDIEGKVKLNLRAKDGIKSVSIFVRGDLVTSAPTQRDNFLQFRKYLWTISMGNPRGGSNEEWKEKLQGEYEWPFSVKIPTFVTNFADPGEQFRLPHSFLERDARGSIDYCLGLHVQRSKFQPDDTLENRFGFFTMSQPATPSLLRQLAYESNVPVPGPYVDPEGWHSLETVQICGRVFGERTVDARCTVFLAKPLCYTRGTAIPCAMTIETTDAQAADLLASINSSTIYLQRCLKIYFDGASNYFSSQGRATWWPDTSAPSNVHCRYLLGEMRLKKDLYPSSAIKRFRVEYSVVVFPPEVTAFTPEIFAPLASQTVEIATRFAPGVHQQPAAPPAYEPSSPFVERYYKSLSEVAPKCRA